MNKCEKGLQLPNDAWASLSHDRGESIPMPKMKPVVLWQREDRIVAEIEAEERQHAQMALDKRAGSPYFVKQAGI